MYKKHIDKTQKNHKILETAFKDKDLIISIKEARKLLGKKYKTKSDLEISQIIQDLSFLSNLLIEDGIIFKMD